MQYKFIWTKHPKLAANQFKAQFQSAQLLASNWYSASVKWNTFVNFTAESAEMYAEFLNESFNIPIRGLLQAMWAVHEQTGDSIDSFRTLQQSNNSIMRQWLDKIQTAQLVHSFQSVKTAFTWSSHSSAQVTSTANISLNYTKLIDGRFQQNMEVTIKCVADLWIWYICSSSLQLFATLILVTSYDTNLDEWFTSNHRLYSSWNELMMISSPEEVFKQLTG